MAISGILAFTHSVVAETILSSIYIKPTTYDVATNPNVVGIVISNLRPFELRFCHIVMKEWDSRFVDLRDQTLIGGRRVRDTAKESCHCKNNN